MNAFKVMFTVMGLIYLGILVWGVTAGLRGVPAMGVFGMLWCGLGWSVTDRCLT
jgi:hypothetical protein